jgi:serine protease Do
MRRSSIAVVVLALVASACSVSLGSERSGRSVDRVEPASLPALPSGREPVAAVAKRVLPAVVNVTTDVFQPDQFGGAEQRQGVGTGFIVHPDGVIVTNCHVVERASEITVSTSDPEPDRYRARVIGGDCEHDLAVLKVNVTGLPTLTLGGSSGLLLGQRVVAVGYALALEGGPTVTTGIVSSLDRTIEVRDPSCDPAVCGENQVRTYADVIQTDAAINHGNSGGPLVDMRGRVVGINSAGADTAENVGFAIAIDSAKDTIADAVADPLAPTAYLGVSTQPVTTDLAFEFGLSVESGAYVLATTSDGPAADAGIQEGDVIVGVEGQEVSSSEDLGRVLDALRPGERVTVQVVGPGGERRSAEVTLGTRPLPTELP